MTDLTNIKEVKHPETIHQDEAGWWFWDETWADRHGPYPTREAAEQELEGYLHWLETGEKK